MDRERKPGETDYDFGYRLGYQAAEEHAWQKERGRRLEERRNAPPPVPWHTQHTDPARGGRVRIIIPCCSRAIHVDPGTEGPLEDGDHLVVCRVCLVAYRLHLTEEEPSGYEEEGDDTVWYGAGFQSLGRVVLAGTRRY